MDPNLLREHLTKLQAELAAAPSVDPGSNRQLGELMDEIKRLMARSGGTTATPESPPPTGEDAADTSLPDRIEKIAVLFEADHPTLAASSRRLVDLLGKVGL